MRKIVFEKDKPSGEVLIQLLDEGILTWIPYIVNRIFTDDETYHQMINEIEARDEKDKILLVVNDNSPHRYPHRCYIRAFTFDELKHKSLPLKNKKDEAI